MVDFDVLAALVAGLAATVVMTLMMTMAGRAGMTDMPSMPLVAGSMVSGDRQTATMIGTVMHYIVMGAVAFGLGYAALFTALDEDAWWLGALIGLGHGLLVGVMAMPMMPAMHPRMSESPGAQDATGDSGAVGTDPQGQVRLTAPGVLGKNWGAMTPVGMLMGHVVYGLLVALIYGWVS